MRALLVKI